MSMRSTLRIAALSGSLRSQSHSTAVLRTIVARHAAHAGFEMLDIGALPHYDQDLEEMALPETVAAARRLIAGADGVLVVSPEFNHGIPGVLKNALDWLSRPAFNGPFSRKPVAFITTAPGALGGVRAQHQLRETFASMRCRLLPLPEIAITHVRNKITDGALSDPATLTFADEAMADFLAGVQRCLAEFRSA